MNQPAMQQSKIVASTDSDDRYRRHWKIVLEEFDVEINKFWEDYFSNYFKRHEKL